MKKSIPVQISLPPATHQRLIGFTKHIGCLSTTSERPKAATAVGETLRMVLDFYRNDDFMEKVEQEGIDALAYIKKCVKNEIKKK